MDFSFTMSKQIMITSCPELVVFYRHNEFRSTPYMGYVHEDTIQRRLLRFTIHQYLLHAAKIRGTQF